jgi:hypothetical protein
VRCRSLADRQTHHVAEGSTRDQANRPPIPARGILALMWPRIPNRATSPGDRGSRGCQEKLGSKHKVEAKGAEIINATLQ